MPQRDQGLALIAARVLPAPEEGNAREIRTRLKNLPMLLHRTGLASTLAFLYSRSGNDNQALASAYEAVYRAVWIVIEDTGVEGASVAAAGNVSQQFTWLGSLPSSDYGRLSLRVIDVALWIKRLSAAQAFDDADDE